MVNSAAQQRSLMAPKRRGRMVFSAALIIIGLILAPLSLLAVEIKNALVNTDGFVEAFAPLAGQPEFKTVMVDVALGAIGQSIDSSSAADWAAGQLESLELSDRLQAPLELLLGQVPGQVEEQLRSLITGWIDSDQFRSVWELMLRGTHGQMVSTFEQDPQALLATGANGSAELQIWPVVPTLLAQQNPRLTDFIAVIPEFTYTIPVGDGETLAQGTKLYSTIKTAGTWLPWLSAAFLISGVIVAVTRGRALIRAALAVAALMVLLDLVIMFAPAAVARALANPPLTTESWELIFDQVFQRTVTTAYLVGAGALVVAGAVWGIGKLAKRG